MLKEKYVPSINWLYICIKLLQICSITWTQLPDCIIQFNLFFEFDGLLQVIFLKALNLAS